MPPRPLRELKGKLPLPLTGGIFLPTQLWGLKVSLNSSAGVICSRLSEWPGVLANSEDSNIRSEIFTMTSDNQVCIYFFEYKQKI